MEHSGTNMLCKISPGFITFLLEWPLRAIKEINCHYLGKIHQKPSRTKWMLLTHYFVRYFELGESVMGQMSGLLELLLFPSVQWSLQPVFPQPNLCSPHHPHHILISLHHAAFYKEDEKITVQSPWSANQSRETLKSLERHPRPHNQCLSQDNNLGFPAPHPMPLEIQCGPGPWCSSTIIDAQWSHTFPSPLPASLQTPRGEASLLPISKPGTMTRVHTCFLSGWTHIRS